MHAHKQALFEHAYYVISCSCQPNMLSGPWPEGCCIHL